MRKDASASTANAALRNLDALVFAPIRARLTGVSHVILSPDAKLLRAFDLAGMDAAFQDAIEAASAAFAGGRSMRMPSAAGHDAQILSTVMPAGMLFVPSIGGISHHVLENTSDADIITGAQVFVETCRRVLMG